MCLKEDIVRENKHEVRKQTREIERKRKNTKRREQIDQ
jgi:hypothetical protein